MIRRPRYKNTINNICNSFCFSFFFLVCYVLPEVGYRYRYKPPGPVKLWLTLNDFGALQFFYVICGPEVFPWRKGQSREYFSILMMSPKYYSFLRIFVARAPTLSSSNSLQYVVIYNSICPRYFRNSFIYLHYEGI